MYDQFQGGGRPADAFAGMQRRSPKVIGGCSLTEGLISDPNLSGPIQTFITAVQNQLGPNLTAMAGFSENTIRDRARFALFQAFCTNTNIGISPAPLTGSAQCTVQFIVTTRSPLKFARRFDRIAAQLDPPCGANSYVGYYED